MTKNIYALILSLILILVSIGIVLADEAAVPGRPNINAYMTQSKSFQLYGTQGGKIVWNSTTSRFEFVDKNNVAAPVVIGPIIMGGNITLTGANPTISSTNASALTIQPAAGQHINLTTSGAGRTTIPLADINGGNIDGTVIGLNSAAAGTFTSVVVDNITIDSNALTMPVDTHLTLTTSGTGRTIIPLVDINGGNIDGTIIGANSAAAANFTTIGGSGALTLSGGSSITNTIDHIGSEGTLRHSGLLSFNARNIANEEQNATIQMVGHATVPYLNITSSLTNFTGDVSTVKTFYSGVADLVQYGGYLIRDGVTLKGGIYYEPSGGGRTYLFANPGYGGFVAAREDGDVYICTQAAGSVYIYPHTGTSPVTTVKMHHKTNDSNSTILQFNADNAGVDQSASIQMMKHATDPYLNVTSALINFTGIGTFGSIQNTPIGSSTVSTGAFSTLSSTGQYTNTLAIGTSPFAVTSTTVNTNLNSDMLDGLHDTSFAKLSNGNIFTADQTIDNSGDDTNSYKLKLIAQRSGPSMELTGSIYAVYGADPYVRFSAPNDSGVETPVFDMKDTAIVFTTDNTVDIGAVGAVGANRPKNYYGSGTGTFGTATIGSGSLNDSSGLLTFNALNLSTTGTLASGTHTISSTTTLSSSALTINNSATGNATIYLYGKAGVPNSNLIFMYTGAGTLQARIGWYEAANNNLIFINDIYDNGLQLDSLGLVTLSSKNTKDLNLISANDIYLDLGANTDILYFRQGTTNVATLSGTGSLTLSGGAGVTNVIDHLAASGSSSGVVSFDSRSATDVHQNTTFQQLFHATNPYLLATLPTSGYMQILGNSNTTSEYILDLRKTTTGTNSVSYLNNIISVSSGNMVDLFGVGQQFSIRDDAGVDNIIGSIEVFRSGADNTGKMQLSVSAAGTPTPVITFLAGTTEVLNTLKTATITEYTSLVLEHTGATADSPTLNIRADNGGNIQNFVIQAKNHATDPYLNFTATDANSYYNFDKKLAVGGTQVINANRMHTGTFQHTVANVSSSGAIAATTGLSVVDSSGGIVDRDVPDASTMLGREIIVYHNVAGNNLTITGADGNDRFMYANTGTYTTLTSSAVGNFVKLIAISANLWLVEINQGFGAS